MLELGAPASGPGPQEARRGSCPPLPGRPGPRVGAGLRVWSLRARLCLVEALGLGAKLPAEKGASPGWPGTPARAQRGGVSLPGPAGDPGAAVHPPQFLVGRSAILCFSGVLPTSPRDGGSSRGPGEAAGSQGQRAGRRGTRGRGRRGGKPTAPSRHLTPAPRETRSQKEEAKQNKISNRPQKTQKTKIRKTLGRGSSLLAGGWM